MDITKCILSFSRHAETFEEGLVFSAEGIIIHNERWNDKGRSVFRISVHGKLIGSTSSYPKAIGMGVLALHKYNQS